MAWVSSQRLCLRDGCERHTLKKMSERINSTMHGRGTTMRHFMMWRLCLKRGTQRVVQYPICDSSASARQTTGSQQQGLGYSSRCTCLCHVHASPATVLVLSPCLQHSLKCHFKIGGTFWYMQFGVRTYYHLANEKYLYWLVREGEDLPQKKLLTLQAFESWEECMEINLWL